MLDSVIIPVKSFGFGKRRLAGALDAATRSMLGRRLADHVASTVADAGLVPVIVTADAEVAEWSDSSGYPSVADPGTGLDAAVRIGVERIRKGTETWVALHSDLPLLDEADVQSLAATLERRGSVIAPSADGGTSAIGSREPIAFSFGVGSFHRHLPRLIDPGVVTRQGLLHDLDSPADLDSAATTYRGRWIVDVIGRMPST